MIRVAALTGAEHQPSSRFRVRQHLAALDAQGVEVADLPARIDRHAQVLPPSWERSRLVRWPVRALTHAAKVLARGPDVARAHRADAIWLQRELTPGIPSWEPLFRKPVLFDVDDAIWQSPPAGQLMAKALARRADVVVAGNRYLADWFSAHARRVEIVPTAVDCRRFAPRAGPPPPVLGWIGTASNLGYLERLEPALKAVLSRHPDWTLEVVSNAPPSFPGIEPARWRFVPWTAEAEVERVQGFGVGLMPLDDGPWTRGKCSFKMIQYMACGIPVVVSPVGMNAEVLSMAELGRSARATSEWIDALDGLMADSALRRGLGAEGRAIAETRFSSARVAVRLAELFRELTGSR